MADPAVSPPSKVATWAFTKLTAPRRAQKGGRGRERDLSTSISSPPGAERLLADRQKETLGEPRGDRQSLSQPRRQPDAQGKAEIKLAIPVPTAHSKSLG